LKLLIIFTILGYPFWVMVSFFILSRMSEDMKEKCPSLIDKRWKRVLWLLSCLLFIPLLLIPISVLGAVKEFITGEEDKDKKTPKEK